MHRACVRKLALCGLAGPRRPGDGGFGSGSLGPREMGFGV